MKELFAALVRAQAEIGAAVKDSTNPHFRSRYADLASVVAAIKPAAAKYGLGYIQRFSEAAGGVVIETIIVHESGQQLSCGPLFVPATKLDAQGYGSAITYARRYSLQTAWGVPADDDDGNAAAASAPPRPAAAASAPPRPAAMAEGAVADHLAAIESAESPEGLKAAWQAARAAAQAAQDADAVARFDAAKDARKATFKEVTK